MPPINQSVALSEWAKQRGFEVVKVYEEEKSRKKFPQHLTKPGAFGKIRQMS